jgi:hypothetical protein
VKLLALLKIIYKFAFVPGVFPLETYKTYDIYELYFYTIVNLFTACALLVLVYSHSGCL